MAGPRCICPGNGPPGLITHPHPACPHHGWAALGDGSSVSKGLLTLLALLISGALIFGMGGVGAFDRPRTRPVRRPKRLRR
jgi:hypothetical protein